MPDIISRASGKNGSWWPRVAFNSILYSAVLHFRARNKIVKDGKVRTPKAEDSGDRKYPILFCAKCEKNNHLSIIIYISYESIEIKFCWRNYFLCVDAMKLFVGVNLEETRKEIITETSNTFNLNGII